MRGEVINGFVVGDLLGSGRSGLLYQAEHQGTKRKAIVRVVSSESGVETEVFIQEATGYLPHSGRAEFLRATLDDGRIIHLAVSTSATAEEANKATARLPSRAPAPTPPRIPWLAVLASAAVLAALVGAFAILWTKASTPQVIVVHDSPPPPARQEPVPVASPPATEPLPLPPPLEKAPPVAKPNPPAAEPKAHRAAPAPAPQESCTPDDKWRSNSRRSLAELRVMATADSAKFERFEDGQTTISHDIASAASTDDCLKVERALKKLYTELQ